jgi:cell division protein FtsB
MGVTRVLDLETRLSRLDDQRVQVQSRSRSLQAEMSRLEDQIGSLRGVLDEMGTGTDVGALEAKLDEIALELEHAQESLLEQSSSLELVAKQQQELGVDSLDARINQIEAGVNDRWHGLSEVVTATSSLAERTRQELGELNANLDPDVDGRWEALLGPTVQLAGETTVGSGVLLHSEPTSDGSGFETILITSWHVVRDILADAGDDNAPVPVTIYHVDSTVQFEHAELRRKNVELDVALLAVHTDEKIENGARLATPERLANTRIFQGIYAVGCPLGNDPIPTRGEIADTQHEVDGSRYWMISAPTYIGNSGGGIFDERTHELLGIFSKIYTHGSLRPTVVPHMGLVTPLDQVYEWLETEGDGTVEEGSLASGPILRLREPEPEPASDFDSIDELLFDDELAQPTGAPAARDQ